jgi:hypothetical protein
LQLSSAEATAEAAAVSAAAEAAEGWGAVWGEEGFVVTTDGGGSVRARREPGMDDGGRAGYTARVALPPQRAALVCVAGTRRHAEVGQAEGGRVF